MRFLLAHGPNLNLLGSRDPDVYGTSTLADLEDLTTATAAGLDIEVETFQSNHEGALLDRLHGADVDGVILNAGAWTHTSYAVRDAIEAIGIPTVELHLSNIVEREEFRRVSVVGPVCIATIYGRGDRGYVDAVRRLHALITWAPQRLAYGSHPDQFGELRLPEGDGPFPVVALLHGGFWRHQWTLDTLDGLSIDLARHGLAAWNIEYRRVGLGGGGATTMGDVESGLAHLDELPGPLDPGRTAVVGHSAGGQLALWGSTTRSARLAVSLAGVTDLVAAREQALGTGAVEAFLGGSSVEPYSPLHLLPTGIPSLCVHGTADDAVPFRFSEGFVAAAATAGDRSELIAMEGADHFAPIDPRTPGWIAARSRLVDVLGG